MIKTDDDVTTEETQQTEETPQTEETQQTEEWMKSEDDKQQSTIPAVAHLKIKEKLKTRVAERDDEISRLKQEIEALKQNTVHRQAQDSMQRPRRADFEDDEAYFDAIDRYQDKAQEERYNRLSAQRSQDRAQKDARQSIIQAVDNHYDRASKLLIETGISEELYKNADISVRNAVSDVMGQNGDDIIDQFIHTLGEGSEKVMYYVGNNRNALNEFKSLLLSDPSGLKAAVYLGAQKNRLNKPGRMQSSAPAPASEIPTGDQPVIGASELQKRYSSALKRGDVNAQINAKLDARRQGVDTSAW